MAKARRERPNYNFSKGINTDASLVSFPLNYTADEENFELMPDGSRKRRKGLARIGGTSATFPYYEILNSTGDQCHRTFKWPNVGGDPTLHFIVVQYATYIYFYEDVYPISSHKKDFYIDLASYAVSGDVTSENISDAPVQIASGNGYIILTHKYINPLLIEYQTDADDIEVSTVVIKERLFELLEDGVENTTTRPTAANYSDLYKYNLLNQGWTETLINDFFTDTSTYPAKNMLFSLGYRRVVDAGYYDADGVKEFSSDKLLSEAFGDALAPLGHIVYNSFDTFNLVSDAGADYTYFDRINQSTVVPGSRLVTIKLRKTGHGLTTGDTITLPYYPAYPSGSTPAFNFISFNNGASITEAFYFYGESYQVTVLNANDITITITVPDSFVGLIEDADPAAIGAMYVGVPVKVENEFGDACVVRPSACAWFAGRAWYSGVDFQNWSSKIYFSQVAQYRRQLGLCYQQADPTSMIVSDLVDTDGGVINIPEAGKIYKMVPHSSSLLIYADNGVWQIGPGDKGYFTATSYSIRKITDAGVYGPDAIVIAENIPIHWGKSSIFRIVTDLRQGFLVAENISTGVIDTLFQGISLESKRSAQGVYDDLVKRVVWLYTEDDDDVAYTTNQYNKMLIYYLGQQAFVKWHLYLDTDVPVVTLFTHRNIDFSELDNKINMIALGDFIFGSSSASGVYTFSDATTFTDMDVSSLGGGWAGYIGDSPEAYILTGYDTAGVPDKFKYAPVIHTFMKKTETGYTEDGPVGESSLTMQARWDWADNSSAGKWGTAQQCYRHNRQYVPSYPLPVDSFNDGQPLVVARNKVRGRGRALHLKFQAGDNKNAHIAGWSTNYDILTED